MRNCHEIKRLCENYVNCKSINLKIGLMDDAPFHFKMEKISKKGFWEATAIVQSQDKSILTFKGEHWNYLGALNDLFVLLDKASTFWCNRTLERRTS